MAIQSVVVNRLRAMLSLLGITIGIFAIIAVFTIVDSLETNIRESFNSLGSDVIYIEKWPWAPPEGEEWAWWKYMNRPLASLDEYEFIKLDFKFKKKPSCAKMYKTRDQLDKNKINRNWYARNQQVLGCNYSHVLQGSPATALSCKV